MVCLRLLLIKCSGHMFCLALFPHTPGRWPFTCEADGSFFIDRDPKGFSLILQCLRGEKIEEASVSAEKMAAFRRDVEYYCLPAELVDRCLVKAVLPAPVRHAGEQFSSTDHSESIAVIQNSMVARHTLLEQDAPEWVLGANWYGGQDHVLITISIDQLDSIAHFGVIGRRPVEESYYGWSSTDDDTCYGAGARNRVDGGEFEDEFDGESSGSEMCLCGGVLKVLASVKGCLSRSVLSRC